MKRVTFAFELGRTAARFRVSREISRANRACTHDVQAYVHAHTAAYVFAQNPALYYFSRHLAAVKMLGGENLWDKHV